jgi:Na+-translocating ferredoxin:NAD+ oxidoreductase subunit B
MQKVEDVYQKLAKHLDNLPGGFPPTQSGVELRILRRLFSPEDAELALYVNLIPEESRVIARRAGISRNDADLRLANMARKGLIMGIFTEKGAAQYIAAQFVIGIWEFHVNDLDAELIRDFDEYLPALMRESFKVPQLRTIPVNRSLSPQLKVLPYESAEDLVRKATKFLVAPCICRREKQIAGEGCGAIEEACLVFDMGADLYLRNGLGRLITREETFEILARADDAGLVLQPGNSKNPMNICCCCGCCCGVLRSIKPFPKPATLTSSPFITSITLESCDGCGVCTSRCQMDALRLEEGKISLDQDRCIGCGLCVSTCPTDSMVLVRKPPSEQPKIPKDGIRAAIQLARARGKLTSAEIAFMILKSKVDRLRALR